MLISGSRIVASAADVQAVHELLVQGLAAGRFIISMPWNDYSVMME
jgi:hypothetical protein